MKEGLTPSKIDQFLARIKPQPVAALVDDDPKDLDLLERILRDENFEIHRFSQAEDLLARLEEIRPDVIVTEVILPGLNGLSLLDKLRPKNPEEMIPVLVLTKKNDPRSKLLAFRRGAFDYMTKPFEVEELAARVRALVRNKLIRDMLQTASVSDPLTSLYNQRFLLIWLEKELERVKRYGLDFSCLLFDLDGFREINEENGKKFGDFLLQEFGDLMNRSTRRCDLVGRLQNDQFLLILPGTSKEKAIVVARRLRQLAAERNFELRGKKTKPTFCIGVTGGHAHPPADPSVLLERATEALRKAKAVGIGQTAVLDSDS